MFQEGSPEDHTFEFAQCPHCGGAVPVTKNMSPTCPSCHETMEVAPPPQSLRRVVVYIGVVLAAFAVLAVSLPLVKLLIAYLK